VLLNFQILLVTTALGIKRLLQAEVGRRSTVSLLGGSLCEEVWPGLGARGWIVQAALQVVWQVCSLKLVRWVATLKAIPGRGGGREVSETPNTAPPVGSDRTVNLGIGDLDK
jgi:hypothetical protein